MSNDFFKQDFQIANKVNKIKVFNVLIMYSFECTQLEICTYK